MYDSKYDAGPVPFPGQEGMYQNPDPYAFNPGGFAGGPYPNPGFGPQAQGQPYVGNPGIRGGYFEGYGFPGQQMPGQQDDRAPRQQMPGNDESMSRQQRMPQQQMPQNDESMSRQQRMPQQQMPQNDESISGQQRMSGAPQQQMPQYGYYNDPQQQKPQSPRSDEAFMQQLDTFKDKARQLQGIINEKQDRVDFLEEKLDELTQANHQLQDELEHDRQQTGDYAVDIEGQVNRLSEILGQNINDMEERISQRFEELPIQTAGDMQEITIDTQAISDRISEQFDDQSKRLGEHLNDQSARMEKTFASISDKLEAIIEKQQRVLDTTIDGHNDKLDSIEKLLSERSSADPTVKINKALEDQKSFLSTTLLNQEKKLTNSIEGVNRELDGVKETLSEKIHAEDVKVYRNLQDFIKDQDHTGELEGVMKSYYKKLRIREFIIMGLVLITILLSVFFIYIIM